MSGGERVEECGCLQDPGCLEECSGPRLALLSLMSYPHPLPELSADCGSAGTLPSEASTPASRLNVKEVFFAFLIYEFMRRGRVIQQHTIGKFSKTAQRISQLTSLSPQDIKHSATSYKRWQQAEVIFKTTI